MKEIKKELRNFHDMIGVAADIPMMCFDSRGNLSGSIGLSQNMTEIFLNRGCKDYLFSHEKKSRKPVILSGGFGIFWGGAFAYRGDRLETACVIGPVLTAALSDAELKKEVDSLNLPLTFRSGSFHFIRSLPFLPYGKLCEYTRMLHFLLQHEKLSDADLARQDAGDPEKKKVAGGRRNYQRQWDLEQALMAVIEQGQLDYSKLLSKAFEEGAGPAPLSHDALEQAHYDGIVMTSLCIRALIRAGSTAESAFDLGESYLVDIASSSSVPEVQTRMREMFDAFVHAGYTVKHIPEVSGNIQGCCEYIAAHLQDDLSVTALSERLHYSGPYLERRFRQEMKTSISNYVTLMRLEYAKTLLIATDTPIAQIASQLRFCSSSHFSSKFRSYTGSLPLAYRKQYRQA